MLTFIQTNWEWVTVVLGAAAGVGVLQSKMHDMEKTHRGLTTKVEKLEISEAVCRERNVEVNRRLDSIEKKIDLLISRDA